MSNYYLQAVILENCPYSNAATKLLKNNQSNTHFTIINNTNKDNYKTKDIDTFPQIYLKRYNKNGSLLIGGYTNLEELFNLFYKKNYSNENITNFIDNNNKWSRKPLLRFINLINSI